MDVNVTRDVAALQRMTPKRLREKYAEVFGESTTTGNRVWLVRRIAWRPQCLAEGGLTERALARAAELARDADLRVIPPTARAVAKEDSATRTVTRATGFAADDRLPPPGSVITRQYKGMLLQVTVLADGFEYTGERYTAVIGGGDRVGPTQQRVALGYGRDRGVARSRGVRFPVGPHGGERWRRRNRRPTRRWSGCGST